MEVLEIELLVWVVKEEDWVWVVKDKTSCKVNLSEDLVKTLCGVEDRNQVLQVDQ